MWFMIIFSICHALEHQEDSPVADFIEDLTPSIFKIPKVPF